MYAPTKAESNVRTEASAVRHDDAPPSDVNTAEKTNSTKDSGDDASARRAAARERLRARRSQRNRRNKKDEFRTKGSVENEGKLDRSSDRTDSSSAEVENLKARVRRSAKNALKNAKSAGKSKISDVNVEPTDDGRSPENSDGVSSRIANAASEGESSTKLLSRLSLEGERKSRRLRPLRWKATQESQCLQKAECENIYQNKTSVQDLKRGYQKVMRSMMSRRHRLEAGETLPNSR